MMFDLFMCGFIYYNVGVYQLKNNSSRPE